MADRSRHQKGPLPPPPESSLLGDLESIRGLLSREGEADELRTGDDTPDVPILDDVVDGALQVDESPLEAHTTLTVDSAGDSLLGDETIKALLGDEWRTAADEIIRSARKSLSEAAAAWSADDTEMLARMLNGRIDDTIGQWMHELTVQNVAGLRERLIAAITDAVKEITDQLTDSASHGE